MRRRLAMPALVFAAAVAAGSATFGQQGAPMFGGFLSDSSDPISIDADRLEWSQQSGQDVLVYSGDVVAERGEMSISAGRLAVFLPAESGAGRTFDRIEASGNVSIQAGEQTASAQLAIMDMVAQTVVMTGDVALFDGANEMAGDSLTIDLATGGWQLGTGAERVRTVVNPNNDQ